MKKVLKPIITILIAIIILNLISSFYTYSLAEFDWKTEIDGFANAEGEETATKATQNIVGAIAVVVRIAGIGVAVIMLIVLGMKYMIAAPGDKADIKKHAIVYAVGAIVLFATTSILEIIAKFAENISAEGGVAGE